MYRTEGVEAVATITELRASTARLLDFVQSGNRGVMIQRNNEPQGVIISWDLYIKIKDAIDIKAL